MPTKKPAPAASVNTTDANEVQSYMNSYEDPPTRLEMAISLFTRNGSSEQYGAVSSLSVRLPVIEKMTVDALAKHAGLSANKVFVQLVEVALDEVFQGMDSRDRNEIFKIRSQLLNALPKTADGIPDFGGEQAREGDQ